MDIIKHIFSFLTYVARISFLFLPLHVKADNSWHTAQPFPGPVFLENKGIIPPEMDQLGKTGFCMLSGDPVVLGERGICLYVLNPENNNTREKEREREREKEQGIEHKMEKAARARKSYKNIFMNWLGANPHPQIVTEAARNDYFTCVVQKGGGFSGLQMRGYERIVYKELYPGIDLILETDGKRIGFRYSFRLKPGADPSLIRLKFSGDLSAPIRERNGELLLKTRFGTVTHKELLAFSADGSAVPCEFMIHGNEVGFNISQGYDPTQSLTIDPWVVNGLTVLDNNHIGFDVDFDYANNLFVYGGGDPNNPLPFQVAKYNSSGVLQWTFLGIVASVSWSTLGSGTDNYPGNFVVDKSSGKTYITQSYMTSGCNTIRLDAAGNYDNFISQPLATFQEGWDMAFDCNSGEIFVAGGGTSSEINFGILNTTTGAVNATNITGITTDYYQDIANVTNDFSGNIYAIFSDNGLGMGIANKIYKLNAARNGNLWSQASGSSVLLEANNKPFFSNGVVNSNGANVLAVNSNYLFYYDGTLLRAFDKNNGSPVGLGRNFAGQALWQTGIAADNCNNVYVGRTGSVEVYNFNGVSFTPLPIIPLGAGVSGEVHDIRFNYSNNTIYVAGTDFVGVYNATSSLPCNTLSVTATSTGCTGNATATVTTNLTGSTFQYQWLNSSGTLLQSTTTTNLSNSLTGLAPGTYIIRVQVAGNCGGPENSDTLIVSAQGLNFTVNNSGPLCAGLNNGTATAGAITGGTPPYSFSWNTVPVQTTATATGLGPGTYTCVVTDANGCTGSVSATISAGTAVVFTTSHTDPTCLGGTNGTATAIPPATGGPFTYSWSAGGASTSVLTGLSAGAYTCTITNSSGCTGSASVTLANPLPLVAGSTVTAISCNGLSDGTASAIPPSNGAPYTYLWQPGGATTATISGLGPGTYTCTLTAANGCTTQTSVSLVNPPAFTVNTNVINTACYGYDTSSASVSATTGGGPYTYFWQPGGATTATIGNLSPGDYTCTVTNPSGCAINVTVNISEPDPVIATTSFANVSCTGFANGSATVITPANSGPFTYSWQPMVFGGTTSTITNLSPGTYICTLTDTLNCKTVAPAITITEPPPLLVTIPGIEPVLPRDTALLLPLVSGGTPAFTYLWSDGSTAPSLFVRPEETTVYSLSVTDSLGCIAKAEIRIEVPDIAAFFIPRAFSPNGDGRNEGFTGVGLEFVSGGFVVYNRWGEKVYETARYEIPWNGREANEGEICPEGVYVYRFEMINRKGEEKVFVGQVNLLR